MTKEATKEEVLYVLRELIVKYELDNACNAEAYILADFVFNCLTSFCRAMGNQESFNESKKFFEQTKTNLGV